jgi:hypothetical protein
MKKAIEKIKNENINESNINPIVIGSLSNLKLIYINAAEIETSIDDISNIFIII